MLCTGSGRDEMGRPPKPISEVKRHSVGLRTTKAMYDRLHAAAAESVRSVAQEIEYRLEMSFRDDDQDAAIFGDPAIKAVCMMLATALQAEKAGAKKSHADWGRKEVVSRACVQTLVLLKA